MTHLTVIRQQIASIMADPRDVVKRLAKYAQGLQRSEGVVRFHRQKRKAKR